MGTEAISTKICWTILFLSSCSTKCFFNRLFSSTRRLETAFWPHFRSGIFRLRDAPIDTALLERIRYSYKEFLQIFTGGVLLVTDISKLVLIWNFLSTSDVKMEYVSFS